MTVLRKRRMKMRLYHIALKEIKHRKIRTVYTAIGIAVSMSMLIGVVITANSAKKEVINTIAKYGHSLTIIPAVEKTTSLRMFGIATGQYLPEESLPEIERVYDKAIRSGWEKMGGLVLGAGTIGGVDDFQKPTFAPRLYEETTVNGINVIVGGVELNKELIARFWWDVEKGRFLGGDIEDIYTPSLQPKFNGNEAEALLGSLFAQISGLRIGDTVNIVGTPLKVVGILNETDSPDDYMIFTHLKIAQEIFGKQGLISMINVRAMCPKCPVGDAAIAISQKIVGVRATAQKEIATAQSKIFMNTANVIMGFLIISLILSCIGAFNMMMNSIYSRIREIGLLKAFGVSKPQLIVLFLYEAIIIGLIGGIIGFGVGTGLAYLIGPLLFEDIIIKIPLRYLLVSIVLSTLCSTLASIYPAFYAAKIRVVEAFRAL
jgi:putative ABC transport system permease protein